MSIANEPATADPPPADALAEVGSLPEMEAVARRLLPHLAYEYIASGAADEITVRRNREALDEVRLRPRIAEARAPLDTRISLLGEDLPHPILLAPTAYHRLVQPEGEVATARGAGEVGAVLVVSTATTAPLEDIARAARSPLWFQLYVQSRREFTLELVRLAEDAGCRALCLTVDNARLGARNRQARSGFRLPPGVTTPYLDDLNAGRRDLMTAEPVAVTWEEVAWLRAATPLPLVLKGVMTEEDGRRSVEVGAAAVIVSNHAGRNLDTLPATVEALPEVVDGVGGRIPVLMDGGIQRGTDVLKAMALGASAVLIGRPYLYGLGVGGAAGVARVVEILRWETEAAMLACGVATLRDVDETALYSGAPARR
ncbi:MAG TPA: alpha-hydroxy acid oxidase [Longimicrobiaceae bacterium]